MTSKNPRKKISKHKINSKQKVFLSSYMVFRHLHGKKKKTHKLNSHHQMELFDTKIDRFRGQNRRR
jgi:hypothetical protein